MFGTTITILALLSLMIGAPIAVAEHDHKWHDSHGGHSEHVVDNDHTTHGVYDGVHLPSDQYLADEGCSEQKIKSLRKLETRLAKDSIDRVTALAEAKAKMIETRSGTQVSELALHDAIEDYFTAKSDLMKFRATAALEAREVMGDELFEKIAASHR